MAAEQLLTKCPHCGTTFRLTQQHLQIAGGAVRCGACYQVFHASEYIVKTAVVEEIHQPEPPPQAREPQPDPLADFTIDGIDGMDAYTEADFDLKDPDTELFAEDYHQKLMEGGDAVEDALAFDDEAVPAKSKKKPAKKAAGGAAEEDWAKQLLEELGETFSDDEDDDDTFGLRKKKSAPPAKTNTNFNTIQSGSSVFSDVEPAKPAPAARATPKPKRLEEELSDSFKNLGLKGFSNDPFHIDEPEEEEKERGDVDESWAKAMLEELEGDKPADTKPLADNFDYALEDDLEQEELFAAKPLSRSKEEALIKARERDAKFAAFSPIKSGKGKAAKAETAARLREPTRDEFSFLEDLPFEEEAPPTKEQKTSKPEAAEAEGLISSFDNNFFSQFDASELETEEIQVEDALGALHELERTPEPVAPRLSSADIAARVRAHAAQLELEQAPKPQYLKKTLLVLGNLLLITLFVAQLAYFKFDEFSRHPALRPLYAQACVKLGCKLPAQTDTGKIRTNNLVVRSHPTARQALSIDAMISNDASYNQPFPIIELIFEDINGQPVASRDFLPKEYIKDPAIDLKNMIAGTPYHVGLEIVDPGSTAVNYYLHYLPVPD